jgi:hypothetical protein
LGDYLAAITAAGFGRVEVRSRSPYRCLCPNEYPELPTAVMLESIEVAAFKVPDSPDGPAIFSGRTATYIGPEPCWDDGAEHVLQRGRPVAVSDAAAARLQRHPHSVLTEPTYHCRGGGCC